MTLSLWGFREQIDSRSVVVVVVVVVIVVVVQLSSWLSKSAEMMFG